MSLHMYRPLTPGACRCGQPPEGPSHPHRYAGTLADPAWCMCGGRIDAESHTARPASPVAAARPTPVTARTLTPTPAPRTRLGARYAVLRAAWRARRTPGGDTR